MNPQVPPVLHVEWRQINTQSQTTASQTASWRYTGGVSKQGEKSQGASRPWCDMQSLASWFSIQLQTRAWQIPVLSCWYDSKLELLVYYLNRGLSGCNKQRWVPKGRHSEPFQDTWAYLRHPGAGRWTAIHAVPEASRTSEVAADICI